ncbi:MAG TPA: class I SAM-dependent methyltransferase, partial [Tepidisphaeraceae bacterium]|nr:class I SAM-dependent methyltransferase [Tepidisphaeraceae bacterium]
MSNGLVYSHPSIYEAVMLALYGRHYRARYRTVADQIPMNASVLDLCCGPATLYCRHLRYKSVTYHGLDLNPKFVGRLNRAGIEAEVKDLHSPGDLPPADFVVMQASLYHFLPEP